MYVKSTLKKNWDPSSFLNFFTDSENIYRKIIIYVQRNYLQGFEEDFVYSWVISKQYKYSDGTGMISWRHPWA